MKRKSVLEPLDLRPEQACRLTARDRSRVLNFLLRWEWFDSLHACLDVLIPRRPALVSLRDLRAKALVAQGRLDEALGVVEKRIERNASLPARALVARIHLARGDVASARRIARELLKERDESAIGWSLQGEVELAGGDVEAALSAYRRLHALYPNSRAYVWGMTSIYRARGDWVTASGYAVQLLRLADDGNRLPVVYLRGLRDYFRASGETTRAAQMEAELARRYSEELRELRADLSSPDSTDADSELGPARWERRVPPIDERDEVRRERPVERLPSFDAVPVSNRERCAIIEAVEHLFGFDALLPGQLETMACVLRGEDVLTVLPTGGGKSLCYQLPAMMTLTDSECPETGAGGPSGERGTTLVISPLIALMKDQVDSLPPRLRQRATTLNSTLDGDELRRRMGRVADGAYRLVYAAPERLRQPPFLHALRSAGVERLVIDEVHCVSMWGHDFRPDYLIIGQVRKDLGEPPLLAMTATAPDRVRRDIVRRLGDPADAEDSLRLVAGDVTRPNLHLEVFHAGDNDEKLRRMLAFCQAETGSGIVYADTRARCEELAALLQRFGVNAAHYHAGIPDRHRVQDEFMGGRIRVVVATIAFGMGIDKPDIRFIVHFFPPPSLESYYQEAGRAGRDGLPARCVLMISSHDKGLLTRRVRRDVLPIGFLRDIYGAVSRRLGDQSAGRIVMADLERDLRAEDTRVRVALSLLEEAELLRRGPDLPHAARVKLTAVCRDSAVPDELTAFRRASRLRAQQWLTLDLAEVAPNAGLDLANIEEKVLAWQDAGWLLYRPAGRDLLVELRQAPEDAAERVDTLLEQHETVQVQRADEIAAYAATRRCRHGYLNAYLGGRTIDRCRACDNCVDVPPLPDPGLPDEREQLLTILRCVTGARWSWGRQTLLRILRGEGEARYGRRPLQAEAVEQAEYGALSFRSRTAVKALVEGLEYAGFLEPRQLGHGGVVLDVTTKAAAALEEPSLLDALVVTERGSPEASGSSLEAGESADVDEELFEALRAWRLRQARKQEVAPFMILHDTDLRALVEQRPTTLAALSRVKGVGPKKLEQYGAALLKLVHDHLQGDA